MDELEFAEIVEGVCRNPRFRTFYGTFAEVIVFLEGFALGAGLGRRKDRAPYHAPFTVPFTQWMGIEPTGVDNVWHIWLRGYPDEAAALEDLPRLYRRYAETVCEAAAGGSDAE